LFINMLFATSGAQGGNPGATMFMFAAIFAIFYFLLIRPQRQQQKRQEEMIRQLAKGDEVISVGGIVGKIVHLTDDIVTIRTAQDTRIELERSKVGRKLSTDGGSS